MSSSRKFAGRLFQAVTNSNGICKYFTLYKFILRYKYSLDVLSVIVLIK